MTTTLLTETRLPKIAVAGATGRVGSRLIHLLASEPVSTVALTRRSGPEYAWPHNAQAATINFDDKRTLDAALRGVDRLFLAHGTSPHQVANEVALINSAVRSGVIHIVKLSVMGPPTRLNPYAWHTEIESHLAQQPLASTVLRPTVFADVLKRFASQIAAGSWSGSAGGGRVNFIDTRDVAEVARIALLSDVRSESQRVHHLTGPRAWTVQQLVQEFSKLLEHPVSYVDRTPEESRAALAADGLAPFIADLVVGLEQTFRESVHAETTATVMDLTGQAPRDLSDWLQEHLVHFQLNPTGSGSSL
jgi:NAD(P)H dehydrogenase (quinone)